MGETHELFVLALSLVWFAGATPDSTALALESVLFHHAKQMCWQESSPVPAE